MTSQLKGQDKTSNVSAYEANNFNAIIQWQLYEVVFLAIEGIKNVCFLNISDMLNTQEFTEYV